MDQNTIENNFLKMIEDHKGLIFKVARSYCKDEQERPDLIQEIIIGLWKAYPSYNADFKYSTWMYRIALNIAISFYRKNKKRIKADIPFEDALMERVFEEGENQELEEKINLLYSFLNGLKELDRALMLLVLEGKSHQEIADVLGVSKSNVGTKIGRVKMKLKESFNQNK